jgi:threonine dehydrogenase-like Zn-dependent dehydrogenase
MVQLLRLYGASPVVVSELDKGKHAIAMELGASYAYSPEETDLTAVAAEQPGGFDIVIECVGRPESMQTAVKVVGKGAQILLFGVADPRAQRLQCARLMCSRRNCRSRGRLSTRTLTRRLSHWYSKGKWM